MINKINIGLQPNDGTGDSIREGFNKTNINFENLSERVLTLNSIEGALELKANRSEIPSIVGLSTETYVNQKIAQAVVNLVRQQDLISGLNSKPNFSDIPSLDGYATNTYVNQRIIAYLIDYVTTEQLSIALASKANRSELPSIEGLASETWVRNLINDTEVNLTDYFTKSETLAKIAEAQLDGGDVDLSGYATITFVNNGLFLKADKTELQNYATRTYVNQQIANIPQTDLTNYATKSYVNQQIGAIDFSPYATRTWVTQQINSQTVDLSNYYNKTQVDTLLLNKANRSEIPSIVGLATEAYVNKQIADLPNMDLTGYATETYVSNSIANKSDRSELVDFITINEVPTKTSQLTNDSGYVMASALNGYATESYVMNAIANAELGEGQSIDLTIYETIAANDAKLSLKANLTDIPSLQGYATQLYVDNKIALIPTVDLTPYALKTDLNVLATNASVDQKLSNKADRSEIPNISGLASEAWVNQQIANIPPSGGNVDLSDYYRKSETYSKVEIDNKMSTKANVSDIPSVAGLASETYVNQQIANMPQVDLDGYATEQYVNTQISNIDIPSQVNVFANGYGIYSIGSVFSGTNISISNTTELNNKTLVNESGTYTITGIGNDIISAFNITNLTANASVTIQPIAGKTITINGELVTVATTLNQTLKPLLFFIYNQYVIIRY